MEANLSRTLTLLLAVLTALAAAPMHVQKPFNLTKISYNFNTTLYWNYNETSVTPYFQVEYRHDSNSWTIVETCVNTSRNYCDLSEKVVDPYVFYDVRVRAVVGSGMSDYAKAEFYLIDDGIIGPPTINAFVKGKFIYVDVWYPDSPHVNGTNTVGDYLEDLTYDIHYGNETQETEGCDRFGCSAKISFTNQTKFCIWAQGKSNIFPMTIEKSNEICTNFTVRNVQKPFNLTKVSYNFNTTLYWNYNKTSVTPYFQVEYRYYRSNSWIIVETCVNTSRNFCDLSEKIVDPYVYYDVRMRAVVGSGMSDYDYAEFYLINDGIIGPPKISASVEGKHIYVDVDHPDSPRVNGKNTVGDYLEDLTYNIHYGNETEETEECDRFGCSAKILITSQTTYCFWAQGKSDSVPMTIEKSKEICKNITVQIDPSNKLIAVVVSISAIVLILLFLTFFVIKRKFENKPIVPGSLRLFTNNMSRGYIPTDQVAKYDSVTISPVESYKESLTAEEPDKELSDDSDQKESTDQGYPSSIEDTEQKADQDAIEEPNGSKNYYRTEDDGDSIGDCVTENEVTENEPLRDIKPITNSSGYDRPHCLS